MPFDTKKMLESWKKAKPLLLTDTGVSEFLRQLPANPTPAQLDDLPKLVKKLDGFINTPAIKSEKKALACLQQIKKDILAFVDESLTSRAFVLKDMDTMLDLTEAFLKALNKGDYSDKLWASWLKVMSVRRTLGIDPRGVGPAAVPQALFKDWIEGESLMSDTAMSIHKLIEDAGKPKPSWDIDKLMPVRITTFKRCWDAMKKSRTAVKGLG